MISRLQQCWRRWRGQSDAQQAAPSSRSLPPAASTAALDIPPDDVLITYLQHAPGAVEIDQLHLPSAALHEMRAAGVKLLVPLVSQGELIGLLQLGHGSAARNIRRTIATCSTIWRRKPPHPQRRRNWCVSSRSMCRRGSGSSRSYA